MRIGRSGGVPAGRSGVPRESRCPGVDELAHIVRMHAGHVERHGADAVHVFARPEDANASTSPSLSSSAAMVFSWASMFSSPMFIIHSAATPAATTWATGWVPASKRAGGAMYWASWSM